MATPPFVNPGGAGQVNQGVLARLKAMMDQLKSGQTASAIPTGPTQISAARPGGPPPKIAGPGMGGQPAETSGPGGMRQPTVFGVPSSAAAAPGSPQPSNDYVPMPAPQMTPAGAAGAGRAGARSATLHDAVSNLTAVVDRYKKQSAQKTERRAEVLSRSLYDAINRGDQDTVDNILGGPDGAKNIKILEKAGIGVPPELKVEKQEPPTPEKTGVMKGLQKYTINAKPSQAGQAQQNMARASNIGSEQVLKSAQENPDFARSLATGTTLKPNEQQQADRIAAGLDVPAAISAKMSSEERIAGKQISTEIAKLHGDMRIAREQMAVSLNVQTLQDAGRYRDAKVAAGVQHQGDLLQHEYQMKMIDAQEKLASIRADDTPAYLNVMSSMAEASQKVAVAYRELSTKVLEVSPDEAVILNQLATKAETAAKNQQRFVQDTIDMQAVKDVFGTSDFSQLPISSSPTAAQPTAAPAKSRSASEALDHWRQQQAKASAGASARDNKILADKIQKETERRKAEVINYVWKPQ